jgi:ABC-type sugar transport system substrate-binding protein
MKPFRVLLSLITQYNDFQLEQAASARLAAQDLGAELEIVYADSDTITQSTQLLRAIQADQLLRPTAIVFEPVGGTALPQVARAAVAAGIGWAVLNADPAYVAELRPSAVSPIFAVTTDHKEIGRLQAKQVAALLPRGGSILYIQGPSETTAAKDRIIGLQSVLASNIQVTTLKGQWTEESAARCVTSWLRLTASSKSRIDAVVAQNDAMALGARKVFSTLPNLEERDRWMQVPYLGVDGIPKTGQAWVRDGLLTATVVVPAIAGQAIRMLGPAIQAGKAVPERTLTVSESMPSLDKVAPTRLAS